MAGFAGRHSLRYVGVDISPVAVQQARARGLEAYVQRPNELPFEKASFDSVTLLEVIEHLFDVEATLGEIHRVLKPGGVLAVSTPNVAYWRRRLDLALLGRWNPFGSSIAVSEPWRDPHIRFFNPGSIRRLLVKMGFEDVCVRGTGGGLLLDVPWLGHLLRHRDRHASPPYSALEDLAPAPFGCFLMGTCRKSR
jgi:SAM-dependent methyltransferase